jgi:HEAT repeat protein
MSSKPFFLLACLLCLVLAARAEKPKKLNCTCADCGSCTCGCMAVVARAEKPNDNGPAKDDNRVSDSSRGMINSDTVVGGKTLHEHIKALSDPDPSVRNHALRCIPYYGEAAGVAVPDVVKRLKDVDASCHVSAIMALKIMYVPPTQRESVVKGLGGTLVDRVNSQQIHKYEAIKALGRFGALKDQERAAVMDVLPSLSSPNYEVREAAIDALLVAGPDPKTGPDSRVTDALIFHANGFNEHAISVRWKAIMALGALGRPQNENKLSQVVTVLRSRGNWNSSDKIIRMWSHVSLMALEDKVYEKELEGIAKLLKDPKPNIRVQAATALGALRDKAHAYVGDVCELIEREKDPMLTPTIIFALSRMQNHGNRVMKTLTGVAELDDTNFAEAMVAACSALKELAPNDPQVRQTLEKVAKYKSLQTYQRDMVKKMIEDLKNPPKPPEKPAAKDPKKAAPRR